MLKITALNVFYNSVIHAVKGASLEVPTGQVVTLLGSNGAGKTTMLRAISGTLGFHGGTVSSGSISLGGQALHGLAPHEIVRRGVCQIQEGGGVFKSLTVEDNLLAAGLRWGRLVAKGKLERVYAAFPVLGHRRRQMAGYLSGGEQQILAIARMSLMEPRVLMLDEPSLGLAPLMVKEVFRILRQVIAESHTTVLLVEQSTRNALDLADYGYVLENGEIVLSGTAASLRDNPQVRERYLGQEASGAKRSYAKVRAAAAHEGGPGR